jgi:hypothetical protein
VVLTGGSCVGKSSSIDDLQKQFNLTIVHESSTSLRYNGIRPDWGGFAGLEFQIRVLALQFDREDKSATALQFDREHVQNSKGLLYDRASLDGVYFAKFALPKSAKEWFNIEMKKFGIQNIRKRYDYVIHLESQEPSQDTNERKAWNNRCITLYRTDTMEDSKNMDRGILEVYKDYGFTEDTDYGKKKNLFVIEHGEKNAVLKKVVDKTGDCLTIACILTKELN